MTATRLIEPVGPSWAWANALRSGDPAAMKLAAVATPRNVRLSKINPVLVRCPVFLRLQVLLQEADQ